jgi:hypothetical protein
MEVPEIALIFGFWQLTFQHIFQATAYTICTRFSSFFSIAEVPTILMARIHNSQELEAPQSGIESPYRPNGTVPFLNGTIS